MGQFVVASRIFPFNFSEMLESFVVMKIEKARVKLMMIILI
jgi:hypothetical protein